MGSNPTFSSNFFNVGESFNGRTSISKIEYGSPILSSPAISESSNDRTMGFEPMNGGLIPSSEANIISCMMMKNEL